MISGTSAPRCAWCRARRGQSALGRAATAGRGPGAVRRAQVGGLWPGLAGPAAQQPGRGGAQLDPGLGRRTDVAAAGQAERGYRAGPRTMPARWSWRRPRPSAGRTGARWASPMPRRCRMAAATPRPRTICAARSGNGARTSPASTRCWRRVRNAPASRCRRVATWPATRRSAPSPRRSRSCSRRAGCLPTSTSSRRSTCRSRKSGQTGGRAAA